MTPSTAPRMNAMANQPIRPDGTTGRGMTADEREYWAVVLRAKIAEVEALKKWLSKA